jgi:hypothetical protein
VELKGTTDTSMSGAVATDRTRNVAAKRGKQTMHIDRTGHFNQAEIQRDAVFDVQVSRVHNAGAATMAGLRWRLNRTLPAEQTTHATPARINARMTQLVPREVLKEVTPVTPAQQTPQPDHRSFHLPEGASTEAMAPYGPGQPATDQLHAQIRCYLVAQKDVGEAAMREHDVALAAQLSPPSLGSALKRLTSDDGLELTAIAARGNSSTKFVVVVKARPVGWTLQDTPIPGGQAGQVWRDMDSSGITISGNRLMPATATGGLSGGPVNAGVSVAEQLKEQSSDSQATRLETSRFQEGNLGTVEVPMVYSVTVHEVSDTGKGAPKVKHSERLPETSQAVYYLKMLQHEYLDGLRQLESGRRAAPPLEAAAPKAGKPELRAAEYVVDAAGNRVHHPYQPMVAALSKAVNEQRTVSLTIEETDGERNYQAFQDGTMTEIGDGSGYAEAFADLHPTVALMCEGRVPLRELYNATPRSESFNAKVAEQLVEKGVPLSMLKGLDHSATVRQLPAAPGHGERQPTGGAATARTMTGQSQGPSLAGS